jgi:hypothetical protein
MSAKRSPRGSPRCARPPHLARERDRRPATVSRIVFDELVTTATRSSTGLRSPIRTACRRCAWRAAERPQASDRARGFDLGIKGPWLGIIDERRLGRVRRRCTTSALGDLWRRRSRRHRARRRRRRRALELAALGQSSAAAHRRDDPASLDTGLRARSQRASCSSGRGVSRQALERRSRAGRGDRRRPAGRCAAIRAAAVGTASARCTLALERQQRVVGIRLASPAL